MAMEIQHAPRPLQPNLKLPASSSPFLQEADHVSAALSQISFPAEIMSPAPPPPSRNKFTYSLSSRPPISPPASSSSSSRSRSRSRTPISSSSSDTFMFGSPASSQFSRLWDEDSDSSDLQFSSIHPLDHLKTLLSQLAASISALTTAYAHQQAVFNPFNIQRAADIGQESIAADISAADKAMTEGLERLLYLNVQLSVLPHLQLFGAEGDEGKKAGSTAEMEEKKKEGTMLKRYEGIITRFHEEIARKDAVTAALKETLARSMLQGEKLERRVKVLETALSQARAAHL